MSKDRINEFVTLIDIKYKETAEKKQSRKSRYIPGSVENVMIPTLVIGSKSGSIKSLGG